MEQSKNKGLGALNHFHAEPHKWNCAQSIIKSRQNITGISDEEIEEKFRPKGGGKAEDGICGAVYAACTMMDDEAGKRLKESVMNKFGAITCQGLKGEGRAACKDVVQYVDEWLENETGKGTRLHFPR